MGLFSRKKNDDHTRAELANIVIGYYRTKIENHVKVEWGSEEYERKMQVMAPIINSSEFIELFDKKMLEDVYRTHELISKDRSIEMFGEYMTLLYTTYQVTQHMVKIGKMDAKITTPSFLVRMVHQQVKDFIKNVT